MRSRLVLLTHARRRSFVRRQVGEDELILGKTWKLNAERNNGRAAMMGITGMIIHEALTGNPIFPIGETL